MDLELKVQNFGPIDEATIQVGRFTVFAGPNNTGKTFVAKMLYSMLGTINANPALVFFEAHVGLIYRVLELNRDFGATGERAAKAGIRRALQKIDSILREAASSRVSQNELDVLKSVQPEIIAEIEAMKTHFQILKNNIEREEDRSEILQLHGYIKDNIDNLDETFRNEELAIYAGWALKFSQNVSGNFQVSDISQLKGVGDSPLSFSIQGLGSLEEANQFNFILDPQIVQNPQSFPKAFYLESQLYWKLKNPLESIKLDSSPSSWASLNGVPSYFYDVVVALRRQRIDHPFAEIHKGLHNAIGGKIVLSEAGDLEFQTSGGAFPLSLTSAGVANMGMLALLIERGALEPGSFLFIDEPEANLHPAWQVEMAEFLFELARQGVHVVISTHSMTILKWLEVHLKKEPENRALVRLNKFPPDAEWNDDMDAVMAEAKQSLTQPFSDLYITGL
ncbi:MAG: AAA family ATPase [Candidatus Poribacteria bacterium]|nr:AAA family ATPase [Candidatus Poribacteria bacterium]